MIYLKLFWSFIQIGLFSFGGGYASMPLIENQVVNTNFWLTEQEFMDAVTISQSIPGPIAVNSATFVGLRVGGFGGAVVATLGCILPSLIIVIILAKIYTKYKKLAPVQGMLEGLRPAVVALIATTGFSLISAAVFPAGILPFAFANIDWIALILFSAGLFVLRKWKCNPIFVMLSGGVLGAFVYLVTGKNF